MPDTPFHTDQLTIIGPGLLGSSVALGLRKRGFRGRLVALARRQATLDAAGSTGAYDDLTLEPAQAISPATMVLIAVPLGGFRSVFSQIAEFGSPGLIVTDVGSTKASVIADAKEELSDLTRVIGAHPMAGSEQAGPEAAEADLFVGKPCVLTVTESDDPEAVAAVESLWSTLGMQLMRMSPAEHDRQAALSSHLPHLASVMLMKIAAGESALDLASTGLAGATRLAASNPPMRADIIAANRAEILKSLALMKQECEQLADAIGRGDGQHVLQYLEQAKASRELWGFGVKTESNEPD